MPKGCFLGQCRFRYQTQESGNLYRDQAKSAYLAPLLVLGPGAFQRVLAAQQRQLNHEYL